MFSRIFKKDTSPQIKKPWMGSLLFVHYAGEVHKINYKDFTCVKLTPLPESNPEIHDAVEVNAFQLVSIDTCQKESVIMKFQEKAHAETVQKAIFGFSNSGFTSYLKYGIVFLISFVILSNIVGPNESGATTHSKSSLSLKGNDKDAMRSKILEQLKDVNFENTPYSFNPKIEIPAVPLPELKCSSTKEVQITKPPEK